MRDVARTLHSGGEFTQIVVFPYLCSYQKSGVGFYFCLLKKSTKSSYLPSSKLGGVMY